MMPPWYIRLRCWAFGHRWVQDTRATPVITLMPVCRWCGKWRKLA